MVFEIIDDQIIGFSFSTMDYRTQPGNRANSVYYMIGEYCYLKNRIQNRLLYLRCHHYPHCVGTAKISLDTNLAELMRPHLCESRSGDYDYLFVLDQMRDLATSTQRSLISIYKAIIITAPAAVKASMTFPVVYQKLQHMRRARFPNNPNCPADTLEVMSGDNPFSEYCHGGVTFENQFALIFASPECLSIIHLVFEIFVDATFRIVPCNFPGGQVLTILGDFNGTVIPLLHILMSGKKEGLYVAGLRKLAELCPDFAPLHAMADFEPAIANSLQQIFVEISVKGCRFHFGQAVLKKIKSVGLHVPFLRAPNVRKWCKKYIAMCTLPANLIQAEVNKLKVETRAIPNSAMKKKMIKFEAYFDRYWMLQKTPEAFSIFGLRHKTNNHAESFHSSMSRFMSNHPAFWKFCDDLVQHVLLPTECIIQQVQAGNQPREAPRRSRLALAEKQAGYEAKLSSNEWTPTKFLEASAHLFESMKMPTDQDVAEFDEEMRELLGEEEEEEPDDVVDAEAAIDDVTNIVQPIPAVDVVPNNHMLCKICLVEPLQVLAMPCRHLAMCQQCDEQLIDRRCVMCRAAIDYTIGAFI